MRCRNLPYREGLSPRVRGSHLERFDGRWTLGSIPACAGEPYRCRWMCRCRPVYPRVCGGAARTDALESLGLGLSPRVRGSL